MQADSATHDAQTPIPPWAIAHAARSSTRLCGTNSHTVALAGTVISGGTPVGNVATTWTGSSANALSATRASSESPWFAEDVDTRTIDRTICASHAGTVEGAGS